MSREVTVSLPDGDFETLSELLSLSRTTPETYIRELVSRFVRAEKFGPENTVGLLDALSNKGRRFGDGAYLQPADLPEIARRIGEAAGRSPRGLKAPAGADFVRVIQPIEDGKAAHALGHFTGSTALFGFAGEMLALLLYKIHETELGVGGFDAFEGLGQERRLDRLKAVISEPWFQALSRVRATRREALHFWDQPANPERDSLNALADLGRVTGELFAHEMVGELVAVTYAPLREYLRRTWMPRTEVQ